MSPNGNAAPDRLTIVLTLKDRGAFTERWLRYMEDAGCPYPVLVADGGSDQAIERRLTDSSNYPRLRYTYLRYPFDEDYIAYYKKLADVVGRVATPYVLIADNDDFYLLEHIPAFLSFLDNDQTYVSCGGYPSTLCLFSANNEVVASPLARDYTITADTRPKSVTDGDSTDRLCYFLTNVERYYLWSSWYSVHRTAALNAAVQRIHDYAFVDPVGHEIHLHASLLRRGKYKAFDVPFLVAQAGTSQINAGLFAARLNLVERFIKANAFNDVHRAIQWFAEGLAEDDVDRIYRAIARWFSDQAAILYPSPPHTPGSLERLCNALRRTLRPLKQLATGTRPAPTPPLRLPMLEKYILDAGSR